MGRGVLNRRRPTESGGESRRGIRPLTSKEKRKLQRRQVRLREWTCRKCPHTWSTDVRVLTQTCTKCETVNWR